MVLGAVAWQKTKNCYGSLAFSRKLRPEPRKPGGRAPGDRKWAEMGRKLAENWPNGPGRKIREIEEMDRKWAENGPNGSGRWGTGGLERADGGQQPAGVRMGRKWSENGLKCAENGLKMG